MSLIVQKFGGSSVANAERVMNVAGRIVETYKNGNSVVVIVSAQGDTTDELIEKAKEINPNATTSVEFKNLMNGVTYTYRICSYKMVDGEKVVGRVSEPKSILMDYYSCSSETYNQRIKRAFGSEKKKKKNFKTSSKAAKQMKTIQIKVWDFQNGKNGTR